MYTQDNNKSISYRLRIAREQAGLSQGQVAKLLDLHRPTISEIEAGRRKVSADELKEFARVYGVSLTWLANTEDEPDENKARVELAARELAKLKSDDLEKLLNLLVSLKKSESD